MDKMEVLARAWIDCDPNRAGEERFSGFHPDDMNNPRGLAEAKALGMPKGVLESIAVRQPVSNGEPRWKWFLPRAEALDAYIQKHGYKIVPIGDGNRPE